MRSRRSFVAVAGALAAVVFGLAVPAGAGEGTGSPPPSPPTAGAGVEAPTDPVDPAVAHLAEQRGISLGEAERRLATQDRVIERLEAVGASSDPDFGGLWADDQDRIVVAATSKAALARIRSKIGPELAAASTTKVVDTTLVELERRKARASARMEALPVADRAGVSAAIDVAGNRVRLSLPKDRAPSPAHRKLQTQSEADGVAVDRNGTEVHPSAGCNSIPRCEPPLRAGVAIHGPNGCSLAFLAKGTQDDDYYMLTAGHCGWGTWYALRPSGITSTIGNTIRSEVNQYGDFQAIKINNPLGWSPMPWVVVLPSAQTTLDDEYHIASEASSVVGTIVCKTGKTTQTSCGEIVETGFSYPGGPGNLGRIEGMDAGPGDSGSPIYKLHKAYGIMHGGMAEGGVLYSGINVAESRLKVEVLNGTS